MSQCSTASNSEPDPKYQREESWPDYSRMTKDHDPGHDGISGAQDQSGRNQDVDLLIFFICDYQMTSFLLKTSQMKSGRS